MKKVQEKEKAFRSEGRKNIWFLQGAARFLFFFAVTAAIICFLLLIWFRPVVIGDISMGNTLEEGEIFLADRLSIYVREPERGDLVLFKRDETLFIKRIIAMPGERVEIVNGQVFIDSVPLDESMYEIVSAGDMEPFLISENAFFVLGDDRTILADSRLEEIGTVGRKEVIAVNGVRIFPIFRFIVFR